MNEDTQQQNTVKDSILEKIKAGEVSMRPRSYFVLKSIILGILAIIGIFVSSLLLSFIFFSLHVSGRLFLLGFGGRGIEAFILLFPWKLFLIDLIIVFVLQSLIKQFRFGYKFCLACLFLLAFILNLL